MAAISVSRTTSSNSLCRFFRTVWSPARGTPRCRRNPKLPKLCCAKSWSPLPFRCNPRPVSVTSTVANLWSKAARPGVRAFFLSLFALGVALLLALYSGAAAELGRLRLASISALAALLVAGWVAVTLVPVLARRTPLRWLGYKMGDKVTRPRWFYIVGIIMIALAALNTGNNLLFLILPSLIATILISGILSSITLSGP